jgi:molybdopterin molybdotransferase
MVEDTEPVVGNTDRPDRVRLCAGSLESGRNVMRQGTSLKRQEVVLTRGQPIRAIEVGLLCEVGRSRLEVIPPASVAVLATGDELVPADTFPRPGQIRNSNGPMLAGLVRQVGGSETLLGVARDERSHLEQLVRQGLQHDCLLLSGGVSAGLLDLVPWVLTELGVRQVFHHVRLKPGKPLWFGVLPGEGRQTLVFGLPGNPVSSLVCFWLFVRPALMRMMGRSVTCAATRHARLATAFRHRGDRPTYHPARSGEGLHGPEARLLSWKGSADLFTLTAADCLVFFPQGDRAYDAGDLVEVLEL